MCFINFLEMKHNLFPLTIFIFGVVFMFFPFCIDSTVIETLKSLQITTLLSIFKIPVVIFKNNLILNFFTIHESPLLPKKPHLLKQFSIEICFTSLYQGLQMSPLLLTHHTFDLFNFCHSRLLYTLSFSVGMF